jgi:cytoskeletal protein CcmA (bactofilin family)
MMRRRFDRLAEKAVQLDEKVIDVNVAMQGNLRFEDNVNLRINGKFEGTLDARGRITVGEKADVRANIMGDEVIIHGRVTGNVKASKALRIEPTAKIYGDMESPALSIKEGAIVMGHIRMEKTATGHNKPMTLLEVSKYLEVELRKVNEWAASGVLPGSKQNGEWFFDRSRIDEFISQGKVNT